MRIQIAKSLGMCFGVRDAIDLAIEKSRQQPLTILGDLVHNETVLAELRAKGIRIAQNPAEVRTEAVMVTAHGASNKAMDNARAHGLELTEATCPLVHFAHRAVQELVREGYHPVIVGKADHVEVRGMTEDLAEFDVILSDEDIQKMIYRPKFGVVAQTTQVMDKVSRLVHVLSSHFPESEVRFVDTICRPTKQRQAAAVQLAQECDVVIVIGGRHSNNTQELVRTCQRHCARVHHVQTAADLSPEWFEGADSVGITAGTSTPDSTIAEVERSLRDYADAQRSAAGRPETALEHLKAA